jgi:hypothetical protein
MKPEGLSSLHDLSANTIYLMGGSFILGSLFTLLLLILLDFMHALKAKRDDKGQNPDA